MLGMGVDEGASNLHRRVGLNWIQALMQLNTSLDQKQLLQCMSNKCLCAAILRLGEATFPIWRCSIQTCSPGTPLKPR